MRLLTFFTLAGLLVASTARADEPDRLKDATFTLQEMAGAGDKGIPQDLVSKAVCAIVVVPGLKKGAFIVGAKFGRGFLTCRQKGSVGWTGPGGIRVEGGSVGFQIGGTEVDVIMLVMNERGVSRLLSSKFTVGGDATAAAGPVGRTAQAETDAMMTAEILTWSRARGVFAGVSLQGATLRQDLDVNKELYGAPTTNKQILSGSVKTPAVATEFISNLAAFGGAKRS